jgi:hypothetical protein
MDDRALDHLGFVLGVVATFISGVWTYTDSIVAGEAERRGRPRKECTSVHDWDETGG